MRIKHTYRPSTLIKIGTRPCRERNTPHTVSETPSVLHRRGVCQNWFLTRYRKLACFEIPYANGFPGTVGNILIMIHIATSKVCFQKYVFRELTVYYSLLHFLPLQDMFPFAHELCVNYLLMHAFLYASFPPKDVGAYSPWDQS